MTISLTERFNRLIEMAGPLPISLYMAEANAHYYASRDPLGSAGDFITAPEISQMFGEMVGIWLADLWRRAGSPTDCHYVELGPGRGTLARDALRTMRRFELEPCIHFVEGSPALQQIQAGLHGTAQWHDSFDTVPDNAPLLIVANEFFDALPVHQWVKAEQGWRERVLVHEQGQLLPAAGHKSLDMTLPFRLQNAEIGAIVETCPAASAIVGAISQRLVAQGGAAVLVDYGYDGSPLQSTLQAVRAHQKVDPFTDPGNCDLTALVDFKTLDKAATQHGAKTQGPIDQGTWLMALGIADRASALAKAKPADAKRIAQDLKRLVDPGEMGSLFKVMAITAPNWPMPEGFGARP